MWIRVLKNRRTINNVEFIGFHQERHIKWRDDKSTRNKPYMVTYAIAVYIQHCMFIAFK
jgi:hypothetical protein